MTAAPTPLPGFAYGFEPRRRAAHTRAGLARLTPEGRTRWQ
jgi:hypothetical protein